MSPFFEVLNKDGETGARRGRLRTTHGVIDTPVFMPVGSHGTVKGLIKPPRVSVSCNRMIGVWPHRFIAPMG